MLISTFGGTGSRIRLALMGISVMFAAAACGSAAVQPPPTVPSSPTPSPSAVATPSDVAPSSPSSKSTTPDRPSVQQLAGQVSDARAFKHLQALQKIADEHGGNRAAGT